MTKKETIKQHYITEFINSGMGKEEAEQKWEEISDRVNVEDGNISCLVCNNDYVSEIRSEYHFVNKETFDFVDTDQFSKNSLIYFRPISLRGIETNNGWTAILSEKDLPSDIGFYWIKDKSGSIEICRYYGKEDVSFRVWITQFTHYQPITKPLQPLH